MKLKEDLSKILEEEDFCVIACPNCLSPMAIFKTHSTRKTSELMRSVGSVLEEISNKHYMQGSYKINPCKSLHVSWHTSTENSFCKFG